MKTQRKTVAAPPWQPIVRRLARLSLPALLAAALVAISITAFNSRLPSVRAASAARLATLLRSERLEVRSAAAKRLVDLDTDGLPVLVEALADDRQEVASAAVEAIDQLLHDWQRLSAKEASTKLSQFAALLADQIEQIPAERRYVCRRWAEHLAGWPMDSNSTAAGHLLANCETILRRSPVITTVAATDDSSTRTAANAIAEWTPRRAPEPPAIYVAPQPVVSDEGDSRAAPLELEPIAASPPPAQRPIPQTVATTEPQRLIAPPAQPIPPPRELSLTRKRPRPEASPAIDEVATLREQSDLTVMRKLHDLDKSLAEAAEAELRRRGYRTVDLPICRSLVHPDADVRRQLAESLPTKASIDPRPWLLQLTEDSDAEVRRTAEGILRTSSDPAMQRRFR